MSRILVAFILFLNSIVVFSQDVSSSKLKVQGQLISLNNMKFDVNADGFPKQYYNINGGLFDKSENLLYEPMHFHFYTSTKSQEKMNIINCNISSESGDSVIWNAKSASNNLSMNVAATMFSNGFVNYKVKLTALKDVELSSINFHIPFQKSVSKYLLGLGRKDYYRRDTVKWNDQQWNKIKPAFWIGNDSLGLYLRINTNSNWLKRNNGSIQINIKGSSMLTDIYTGKLSLNQGDELNFDFNLILTSHSVDDVKTSFPDRFKQYEKLDRRQSKKISTEAFSKTLLH
ncbi:DUF6067 family protein [Pedobacter aquatilis]|uniref:glycoside hydrolase domain-containing protein n=1 Tax=Pedobacter aquatilis TaxID=351343 RepID=UPI0025B4E807|nr:glycoside hydrolase domain-containing protein [Pedobacter aquatilis]MDN3587042.1 DUF6067 family protein [Pedobacter aquatilis]